MIFAKIQKLRREEKGGILILVGFLLVPLILTVGLAIDTSYGLVQKRKLQAAVDASAKAGAMNGGSQLATITSEAQKIFNANTINMTNITGPNVTYNSSSGVITVSASILVPTIFMGVGGISSMTYNATASATLAGYAEVAVVMDLSSTSGQWTSKIINSLETFVNSLPSNVMVSVVPIATQILLDPTTTNAQALFNHLSPTTNDESSDPALYPLSSNYAWNTTNYNNVYNTLYGSTFPTSTSYYPLPGTCTGWGGPGTYLACSAFYPSLCSTGRASCRANYSYRNYTIPAILPLTLNRTIINNYLDTLASFNTVDTGLFTSLMVWGWRALAPEWSDFWLVNRDPSGPSRISGPFPSAYNQANVKSLILVVTGAPKWSFSPIANGYTSACGQNPTKWFMTSYGAVPMTSDKSAYVDITCDNYNYSTIDKTLGLNMATTSYYAPNHTGTTYATKVVSEVAAKYQRICSNIKAKGIKIFVITQTDDSILKSCASSPTSPYYQVSGNGAAHIDTSFVTSSNYINGLIAVQQ
jgi:Flp pilus assembly protein TadG